MIGFVVVAGALAGAGMLFALWPLLRQRAGAPGVPNGRGSSLASPARRLALGLCLAIAGAAVAIYLVLGSPRPEPSQPAVSEGSQSDPHGMSFKEIAAVADELAGRLERDAKDADGWAMLARSYNVLGRYPESVAAYAKAAALAPADAQLLADYADALAMSRDRRLDGEPLRLVQRALKLDPDNLKALALAGTAAFDRADYGAALKHWQHALRVAPADSQYAELVRNGIREVQALAAGKPVPRAEPRVALAGAPGAPQSPASPLTTGATLSGRVKLHPSLAAKVAPTDTVFIFARAAEGPRVPLAVISRSAKEFPVEFVLDDSTAMTPELKLSSIPSVIVVARVSKTGNATAQRGDLQGTTGPVKVGASGLEVEIRELVQ